MITIPEVEQLAFQGSSPKNLTLQFPFSTLTNENIFMESAQLEQSVCEESNLTFGMVYSSCFSVTIFDDGVSRLGQRVIPVLSVDDGNGGTYTRSLGGYVVKSDKRTSDKLHRELKCYDFLTDILSTDFSSWHNSMPSKYKIKDYRNAFFTQIGIAQESITLPNDNVTIPRFKTTELTGADVIAGILQVNGAFGFMATNGKFKYVLPKTTHDYLIDDNSFVQGSLVYEDEPIRPITGVTMKGFSDDYGDDDSFSRAEISVGNANGAVYTIEDNNFVHAIYESQRKDICNNLLALLNGYTYYPTNVEVPAYIGLEPGDVFKIETSDKDIYFPVLKRTLKGISALQDELAAEGESDSDTAGSVSSGVSSAQLAINQVRDSVSELLAQKASIEAQDAAISANNSANSALTQLSIIEDVAGTLSWIRENGQFVLTSDRVVKPDTVYFTYENGEYVPVVKPNINLNPMQEGWYVLDVTDSQSDYIMAHLAVTEAGLWVLPFDSQTSHTLTDSNGNELVDSNGDQLVDWSRDKSNVQMALGYKVLLASDGMTVYNSFGTAVAHYGITITLGSEDQSRLLITPSRLVMLNSVDDEIYSVEPGKRSEHWKNIVVASYQDETEVIAHTYTISDTGAITTEDPYVELIINDQTYTFNTGISCSVTGGVGVTVTITSEGVSAIRDEMQYEDYEYVLTSDTTVTSDKSYYQFIDNEYVEVEPVGSENPSEEGWYEQTEVVGYYPCIITVVYLSSYVLTASMDVGGQIEVTGEGNPVSIVNQDWSDTNKTDTYFRATNKTKGTSVGFGVGSGGENHGIWSNKLKNWMIYTNSKGAVTTRSSMILRENGTRIYGYGTYPAGKLYCFGNNKEILRFASKTTAKTPASKRGLSFMIANGYYAIGSGKTISTKSVDVYLCGGTDASGKYIRSYPSYVRKYNVAPNMVVTNEGTIGRATSSSIRYKHDVEYLTNEENATIPDEKKLTQKRLLKGKSDLTSILDIPVVKFKFNDGYVTGEENFDYSKPIVGLIADDVAKICPDCAVYIKDKDGNDIPETYNTNQLLVRMLYVMQQQEKRIQELEERISILEGGD